MAYWKSLTSTELLERDFQSPFERFSELYIFSCCKTSDPFDTPGRPVHPLLTVTWFQFKIFIRRRLSNY